MSTWKTREVDLRQRITELEAENERLRSENVTLHNALAKWQKSFCEENIKDAERYRYARDVGLWLAMPNGLRCYRNAKADREIDAAREGE